MEESVMKMMAGEKEGGKKDGNCHVTLGLDNIARHILGK